MPSRTVQTYENGRLVGTETLEVPQVDLDRDDAHLRLRQSYSALRAWADDAAVVAAQSTNVTQAQTKALFDRFGKLADGLADLLLVLRADQ